jgi:hypothetical protein
MDLLHHYTFNRQLKLIINVIQVVFNCRKENREMSDCMEMNCSTQKFEAYLTAHGLPLPLPVAPWYQKYIS